ncbi:MAG TPA: SagB family peptide dehydrogenase [Candidatus Angelobacter sp.]|jgi:bacteriocin biosynthesis cyclodehydratase domain-containing protein
MRPRFLRELVMVPFNEEVIIEGAERLQAIENPMTSTMLPDLIGLLNGERTLDDLKSALPGVPEEYVLETLSSLHWFGLIEDYGAGSESGDSNPETLAFLRRYVAVTGANRSGVEAYERLRNSEVLIFGSADDLADAERLGNVLTQTGVGSVVPLRRSLPSAWRAQSASVTQSMVISLSFNGEDRDWHEQLDDWCLKRRLPWLRIVLSRKHNYADIGPLFNAERTPCYRCLQEVHSVTHRPEHEWSESELAAEMDYWTGIAAVEIIYFLSRIGPLATERFIERYDLQQHTSRRLHLLRVPGCPRCRPLPRELLDERSKSRAIGVIHSAIVFEDYISLASRPRTPSVVREDYARLNNFLLTQFKHMSNSTTFQLPRTLTSLERPALGGGSEPKETRHAITRDDLSSLLMTAAGVRYVSEHKLQRWTATAGNLGSVELFAIVRAVEGLSPGVYFYQAENHSLALFQQRGCTSPIPEFMQRAAITGRKELPEVLILLTGAYHRLERKYGEFAYKLVNLDAGVAVSQLHYVAKGLGYSSLTALRWADDLIEEQLNLDPPLEQVTAVVALYATADTATTAASNGHGCIAQPEPVVSARALADFCELGLHEVTERLFQESRMREGHLGAIPLQCSPASRAESEVPSLLLPLPPPDSSGEVTIADVLAQRATVRRYTEDEISPAQLAAILDFAHRGDLEQWREESLAHPLTFYVLAWNVKQFEPGIYAYDTDGHGLRLVAPARSLRESFDLFVQSEFASAAAVIWIAGNLAAACERLGSLGHRYLLLRAGFAGHRLWTAAMAMGLSGGITAGVVSGVAREQFGIDGYQQTSLLAFTTGIALEVEEESDAESGEVSE